jgi:hypothetical protein
MYPRTNSVLVVQLDKDGIVKKASAQSNKVGGGSNGNSRRRTAQQSSNSGRISGNGASSRLK